MALSVSKPCAPILIASCFFWASVDALRLPEPPIGRRSVVSTAAASLLSWRPLSAGAADKPGGSSQIDFAGKSSFFGLAAPPIQGELSYRELLEAARSGAFATVQIAVQHDVVVATTPAGHRYACQLADEDVPVLLAEAMGADGSMPFEMLPLDANRAAVRDAAWVLLNLSGALWVADLAGLLPWDTTPYGSLAERQKAEQTGERKRSGLVSSLRRMAKLSAPARKKSQPLSAEHAAREEALQRVLGLRRWDAAAELRRLRPFDLEDKLRPRSLESKLIQARPYVLERHLIDAADEMKASVAELQARLSDAPWVTPQALDSQMTLPSLEQLIDDAWCVSSDGLVETWIRAHPYGPSTAYAAADSPLGAPSAASPPRAASVSPVPFPRATLVGGGPWAVGTSAEEGEGAEELDDLGDERSIKHGICRLCPEFSRLYNHDVYMCKRLALA